MTDQNVEDVPETVAEPAPESEVATDPVAEEVKAEAPTDAAVPENGTEPAAEAKEEPAAADVEGDTAQPAAEPADEQPAKRKLEETEGAEEQPEAKKMNVDEVRAAPRRCLGLRIFSAQSRRLLLASALTGKPAPTDHGYADAWW